MYTDNVLYRGLFIMALLALLVPTVSRATTAASPPSSARPSLSSTNNAVGWEQVGPASASGGGISNTGDGKYPSLAIAPDGTSYVAWRDSSTGAYNHQIYVRRWNGSSWEEVGSGSASGGGISNTDHRSWSPSVAIAPDGTPYISWEEEITSDISDIQIYVRRWNGSSWEEVGPGSASGGGVSNNDTTSYNSSMAVAPDGTPYVAWSDRAEGEFDIYVRRWNGSSWEEVGPGSASGGGISDINWDSDAPSLAIAPDGVPYVIWRNEAWHYYEIYGKRWNGSAWEEVGSGSASGGGISNTPYTNSFEPAMAIDPNGTPYVAWADGPEGRYEIYVRRWNGISWEGVGTGSVSSVGGSNSIAIAPDGTVYVAWRQSDGHDGEIYVRWWNGSSWEEVGAGSASGGGISDNDNSSGYPSVAVAPDGVPYVAWTDDPEIYVRRWIEPPALLVSPTALAFLVKVGAANPPPRRISIDYVGTDDVITWTASISPTVGWLDITPISGTTPATITATVDASGFSTLIVETQIIVDGGAEALDSPQTIPVKLLVVGEMYDAYLPAIFKNH